MTRFAAVYMWGRHSSRLAIGLLLAFLVACSGVKTASNVSVTAIAGPLATPLPPSTSTRGAPLTPTETSIPPVPTFTVEPSTTPTPEPSATSTPVPTPELILKEGEVKFEFKIPDSSEVISFAIPEEWASIISYAEEENGQMYNEIPLAQAEIVNFDGNRQFMVGNIIIAEETDGLWKKNETVYTMKSYLGFEGGILAQAEELGHIDPNQISAPKVGVDFSVNSQNVPGFGEMKTKRVHNPIIVGAERTNIVITTPEGKVLKTAQMRLDMAYWVPAGDNFSLIQFSVTGHYIMGLGKEPVLLADYNPEIGETLNSLSLMWSNNLSSEADRLSAVAANPMWQMLGLDMLTESTEPSVGNGSNLGLPAVHLSAISP